MTTSSADQTPEQVHTLLADMLPSELPGATLDAEAGEILVPLGEDRARVSTQSLWAACQAQPSSVWPELAGQWLAEVKRQINAAAAAGPARDAGRLRAQAVPRGTEPPPGLSSAFNSAFDLVAVEDRDGSVRMLQQTDLDAMGMSAEGALRRALDRTITEVLVELDVQPHPLPTGGSVLMASAEGVPYVSAGVTSIPQLAGVELPYGALFAVPRHSMILILPVTSRESLAAIPVLAGFAESMYRDAPDPCAVGLYWFADGDAFPVGAQQGADGQQQLVMAPELQSIVDRLPD